MAALIMPVRCLRGNFADLPTLLAGQMAFTVDTFQFFVGDGVTNHEIGVAYTNEQAQDAVGGILADTDTVDLTYTDGTPEIKADIRYQMSLTADATGLLLVGDEATPGNDQYYGTNGAGTKGYYSLPSPGTSYTNEEAQDAVGTILLDSDTIDFTYNDGTPSITAVTRQQMSIITHASGLKLDGDDATPGNTKLYGTNGGGTKGWYDQPIGSRLGTLTADAKSAAFTAVWSTWYTCTAGAYTIDLPTASGNAGKIIVISCNCTSTVKLTLDGNGSETIGGKTTLILVRGDRIELVSDGTNIQILTFTHGDWISYTANITGTTNPTLGGTRTELYTWKRQGQDMLLNFLYRHASAGSGGSGQWLIDLPLSSSVDTAVIATGNWNGSVTAASRNVIAHGTVIWYNGTTYVANASIFAADSTHIGMWLDYDGGGTAGSLWNQTTWPFTASELLITFQARIPISGW